MVRFALIIIMFSLTTFGFAQGAIHELIEKGDKLIDRDSIESLAAYTRALALADQNRDIEMQVKSHYALGKFYRHHAIDTLAKHHIEKGINLAREVNSVSLEVSGMLALGQSYLDMEAYAASIKTNKWIIHLKPTENWKSEKAQAHAQIAVNYRNLSRFDSAMTYAVAGQRLYESINDTAGWIDCLGIRGNLHLLMGDYPQARSLFEENDRLLIAFRDSSHMARNILHLGVVSQKIGNYAEARKYYRRSLAICEKLGQINTAGILNGNIGSSLMQEGRYDEGLPYLKKALALKMEANASPGNLCHTYMDMSELYRRSGRADTAAILAQRVIDLAGGSRNGYYIYNGYLYLASALNEMGEHAEAYRNMVIAHEMRDSLLNENKSKQIQELQIAYETEKKDAEISALEQAKLLETKQKQLYLILGLAFVLLGTGVFIQQRNNVRKNQLLLAKEKEVDTLKSNFFANMSHEFRTPLTLILGPIESRLNRTADAAERDELEMMKRNATRLLRLINDILDISKSEAGQLKLNEEATDISRTVKGLAGSFGSMAETKEIKYCIEIDPSAEDLKGLIDRSKFETVLINLLANAFKFTAAGGKVSLMVRADFINGLPHVHCAVRDTGLGIPPEKLSKIFDRFYQVDDAATRKAQGTGIGLAFSKELVNLMKGSLSVESVLGEGTMFKLVLPFMPLPDGAIIEDQGGIALIEEISDVEDLVDDNELPLLLLVEDNSDVRKYIRSILGAGYRLVMAGDGEAGMNMAFEHIPDVVISDVMMPVMDGYELCRALKTDMRTSHIPVILLTAKSSSESRIKGLETEADVYMSKPFHPKELELQVRNMLNLHQKLRNKYGEEQALPSGLTELSSMEQQFFTKLNKILEEHYTNPEFSVEDLSTEMGMSRSQLHRKLKSLMDESATGYIRRFRLQVALKMIKAETGSISEIAYQVGFNNVSYFNKCFLEVYGKRPGEVVGG